MELKELLLVSGVSLIGGIGFTLLCTGFSNLGKNGKFSLSPNIAKFKFSEVKNEKKRDAMVAAVAEDELIIEAVGSDFRKVLKTALEADITGTNAQGEDEENTKCINLLGVANVFEKEYTEGLKAANEAEEDSSKARKIETAKKLTIAKSTALGNVAKKAVSKFCKANHINEEEFLNLCKKFAPAAKPE